MKTNQLKTNTTRQPSILHPNKGFTFVIWYDVINRISGLNYTEKQFILFILNSLVNRTNFISRGRDRTFISATDIMQEAIVVFVEIQNGITGKRGFNSNFGNMFDINMQMINGATGIRIQKFVRHILSCILTEREIRNICKTYTKKYPNKFYYPVEIEPFARYVIKKMNVFGARLLQKIYNNGQQIVHIAEPKSYFATRKDQFTQFYLNNRDTFLYPYRFNNIPYAYEVCNDMIICYDTYMDRYLKYANLDFSSNIATKIISNSLLDDIISYLRVDIKNMFPKSIKNDKVKVKETMLTINKMISYAECMRLMPASQLDDRHFTINSRGDMSYTPAKKPTYLNSSKSKWLAGQDRMVAKYGKGVKKLFQHYPETIPDFIIEIICNMLKSQHKFCGTFQTFTGDDIVHWYNYKQHHPDKQLGSLGNSCMKHNNCSAYIKFYAENNDVVSMIAIIEDEKIVSRALLWKTNCGANVLDRIYGNDKYITIMKQYAQDKGYIIKARQSYEETSSWVNPIGEQFNKYYTINVKYYKGRALPYMDTFFSASNNSSTPPNDEYLPMTLSNDSSNGYSCRSTSGSITRDMLNYNDNGTDDEHDGMIQINSGEWYQADEVGRCNHYDEQYHTDDLNWSDTDDCYYHVDVSYWVDDEAFCTENDYDCHVYSEWIGDYIWTDSAIPIHNQQGSTTDYTNEGHTDDLCYCDRSDAYMLSEDTFHCEITDQYLSRAFKRRIVIVDENGSERNWFISDELDVPSADDSTISTELEEWLSENQFTLQN